MLRDKVSVPFDFLKPEFDSRRPKSARLSRLAQRFPTLLFFAPPSTSPIKKVLPGGGALGELILPDLRRARDEEFYLMLAEDR